MASGNSSCADDSDVWGEDEDWNEIVDRLNETEGLREEAPVVVGEHKYSFQGIDVKFPYPAYVSQQQLMKSIIAGVGRADNCLLESPTGTGKTAALLCALLAWQKHCVQNRKLGKSLLDPSVVEGIECTCGFFQSPPTDWKVTIEKSKKPFDNTFYLVMFDVSDSDSNSSSIDVDASMDTTTLSTPSPKKQMKLGGAEVRRVSNREVCRHCRLKWFIKLEVPKVYYATRTHSQVKQVIEQLKTTEYNDVEMTILSSRQVSCVNGKVINEASSRVGIDEECRTLRKNFMAQWKLDNGMSHVTKEKEKEIRALPVCSYYNFPGALAGKLRKAAAPQKVWDIEDIKKVGSSCGACPYYGCQGLLGSAQIVFCPYNYLINPSIRSSLKIDLAGSVVVFDEAHNLEDICRDSASFNVTLDEIDRIRTEYFDKLLNNPNLKRSPPVAEVTFYFSEKLRVLSKWIRDNVPLNRAQGRHGEIMYKSTYTAYTEPDEIRVKLTEMGLGPEELATWEDKLGILNSDEDGDIDGESQQQKESGDGTRKSQLKVPYRGVKFIEELQGTLNFVHQTANMPHYNLVLVHHGQRNQAQRNSRNASSSLTLSQQKEADAERDKYNVSLEIMCLNPAIAFKHLKVQAHSIIVASGTLSPMESFAAELDTPFPIRLSADHVIRPYQTMTVCVSTVNLTSLTLNKSAQDDVLVQDELGNAILEICTVVPHGVLVFLPSYSLMETLKKRWTYFPENNQTLMSRLQKVKSTFYEQKSKKEFEEDMRNYKSFIDKKQGCVLFAVFRGKVSEGINFADNQARAVISIGIPFANAGSQGVVLKKSYNTQRKKKLSLENSPLAPHFISGSDWYEIQAFRGINQGLGRCIRHKDDWGAIVLLEARMLKEHNQSRLSNWVRKIVRHCDNIDQMKSSLQNFVRERMSSVATPSPPSTLQVSNQDESDAAAFNSDEDELLAEEMDRHTQLTQVCDRINIHDQPTTLMSPEGNANADLDSSSYSLNESDADSSPIYSRGNRTRVAERPKLQPIRRLRIRNDEMENFCEMATQIMNPSETPGNEARGEEVIPTDSTSPVPDLDLDSSVDMILQTP